MNDTVRRPSCHQRRGTLGRECDVVHAGPMVTASMHPQPKASMPGRQLPQTKTGLVAEVCAFVQRRHPGSQEWEPRCRVRGLEEA